MDSRAYLTRQGWRGDGHSLDHTDRGIRKPLLVSKKVDVLGVGLNKHAAVSDQWWLRAYDQGLKDFGTGKESALANVQKHGVNRGGLYGRFVRGEGVPGTFGEESAGNKNDEMAVGGMADRAVVAMPAEAKAGQKRKREERPDKKSARRKTEEQEIDNQAKQYVLEAQRLGIISTGPNHARKEFTSTLSALPDFDETMARILELAGIAGKQSTNADKDTRGKMKRDFMRAAKALLSGVEPGEAQRLSKLARNAAKVRKEDAKGSKARARAELSHDAKANATDDVRPYLAKTREAKRQRKLAKLASAKVKAGDAGEGDVSAGAAQDAEDVQTGATVGARPARTKPRSRQLSPAKLAEYTKRAAAKATPTEPATNAARPLFIINTAGTNNSDTLAIDPANNPTSGRDATSAISRAQPFTLPSADSAAAGGAESNLRWEPGMPIPLDPRIWAGVTPNELPKGVRQARKAWMALRREGKKGKNGKLGDGAKTAKEKGKSKGERKVAMREAFVHNILTASRSHAAEAQQSSGSGSGSGKGEDKPSTTPTMTATIDGIPKIPPIKVTTTGTSAFAKCEVARARTVARRVLRSAKREARAAEKGGGEGKGWKKKKEEEEEGG
ncbi:hypothetical protein LTR36_006212 [Oleoguttula mirabilis]|uniref:Uncharacterized protein n=1 Tax=Oleoguttula mirabilis TaxID=1507867 RepID=A0AAV9JC91_9PEZI|nr:hypothetical protein LTR36_006212 [Oleoguttula mirabilis]